MSKEKKQSCLVFVVKVMLPRGREERKRSRPLCEERPLESDSEEKKKEKGKEEGKEEEGWIVPFPFYSLHLYVFLNFEKMQ